MKALDITSCLTGVSEGLYDLVLGCTRAFEIFLNGYSRFPRCGGEAVFSDKSWDTSNLQLQGSTEASVDDLMNVSNYDGCRGIKMYFTLLVALPSYYTIVTKDLVNLRLQGNESANGKLMTKTLTKETRTE